MRPLLLCIVLIFLTPVCRADQRRGDAWSDATNPIRVIFKDTRLDLWSLKPVTSPALPPVKNEAWVRRPMDRFVLAKLEAAGLSPAPEANRRALGRRLFFDLTGLPPSPLELDVFANDTAPDAVDKLADRLLASPAFGEHWARMWLDVVRYSDSNGYDWDEFRPQAWRFRDYVIRSLNADKPFDRMIREQIAGDELVPGEPEDAAEQDALIATGYLRAGPWDNSSKLFNEEHRTRAQMLADLTETTAAAFLGMTMTCCRCHDHKTEPLSQADHYRMRAFFAGVNFADDRPLDLAREQEAIRRHNTDVEARAKPHADRMQSVLVTAKERIGGKPDDDKARKEFTKDEKAAYEIAQSQHASISKDRRAFTTGLCAGESSPAPDTKILTVGDPEQPRETVAPGIPSVLDPNDTPLENGRRSALAAWLVSPQNPLTARVIVNRLWLACFGEGIVATPNDFGFSGGRPSHPELLDWLASEFVRDGWSWKRMIRQFVTSATYQQAAYAVNDRAVASDGDNRLFWRMNPKRLAAEQLRDAVLGVSGLLQSSTGGPPVWPELPAEVLAANPALGDDGDRNKSWHPSAPDKIYARSIYLIQKRSVRVPFMETFDLPDNFCTCGRRTVSTVAPQAFSLLNNPLSVTAAKAFARRVQAEAGETPDQQVRHAWRLATGTEPEARELAALIKLATERSLVDCCRAVLNANAFVYVD